ncbi:MAG TPA: hypothetical protein PK836_03055 [Syntrophales bacterium]|nr:hypothetical protein [Syntrophales bacterium]HOM06530.1 hypothetical protein [Syntrophales bacterium]HON99915.1 hypothetical protein [Syntrophales bacterium]HPC00642.1 hypothetical protein [Syntrophales bacterium]HPQ06208.1 hypothetical protein [Syntrophales bacterium]
MKEKGFLTGLGRFLRGVGAAHRERAVALTRLEVRELENIFALLIMGSFIGLPAPPTFLAVELLPFMEREMRVVQRRAEDSCDMMAEMMGALGID